MEFFTRFHMSGSNARTSCTSTVHLLILIRALSHTLHIFSKHKHVLQLFCLTCFLFNFRFEMTVAQLFLIAPLTQLRTFFSRAISNNLKPFQLWVHSVCNARAISEEALHNLKPFIPLRGCPGIIHLFEGIAGNGTCPTHELSTYALSDFRVNITCVQLFPDNLAQIPQRVDAQHFAKNLNELQSWLRLV